MTTQTLSSRLPLPVKPWSSGRVLTTAQREAKRRKDRTTKRARVQKQNDSVKSLQSQIANLQAFVQTHIGIPMSVHCRSFYSRKEWPF